MINYFLVDGKYVVSQSNDGNAGLLSRTEICVWEGDVLKTIRTMVSEEEVSIQWEGRIMTDTTKNFYGSQINQVKGLNRNNADADPAPVTACVNYRHNKRANIAFADGSAKPCVFDEIKSQCAYQSTLKFEK